MAMHRDYAADLGELNLLLNTHTVCPFKLRLLTNCSFLAEKCKNFIKSFMAYPKSDGPSAPRRPRKEAKYKNQVVDISTRERVSLDVELDDLAAFDEELAAAVPLNTRRFVNIFSDAVNDLIP